MARQDRTVDSFILNLSRKWQRCCEQVSGGIFHCICTFDLDRGKCQADSTWCLPPNYYFLQPWMDFWGWHSFLPLFWLFLIYWAIPKALLDTAVNVPVWPSVFGHAGPPSSLPASAHLSGAVDILKDHSWPTLQIC